MNTFAIAWGAREMLLWSIYGLLLITGSGLVMLAMAAAPSLILPAFSAPWAWLYDLSVILAPYWWVLWCCVVGWFLVMYAANYPFDPSESFKRWLLCEFIKAALAVSAVLSLSALSPWVVIGVLFVSLIGWAAIGVMTDSPLLYLEAALLSALMWGYGVAIFLFSQE